MTIQELHRNGQCIIWTGCRKNGYGQFRFKDPRLPGSDHKTRSGASNGFDGGNTKFG